MDLTPIFDAIPHREPFLFIDEITHYESGLIRCRKTFTGDEFFFAGHYPGFPLVPGVILCESILQAGAILLSKMSAGDGEFQNKLPVVAKMGEVRFKQMVKPGNSVNIEVNFVEKLTSVFFLHGKMQQEGKTILQLDFACAMTDKDH